MDLAARLSVARESVSRWENDKEPIGASAEKLRSAFAAARRMTDHADRLRSGRPRMPSTPRIIRAGLVAIQVRGDAAARQPETS
jgi:transcriptional regulator with XRE-family HTH domain